MAARAGWRRAEGLAGSSSLLTLCLYSPDVRGHVHTPGTRTRRMLGPPETALSGWPLEGRLPHPPEVFTSRSRHPYAQLPQ